MLVFLLSLNVTAFSHTDIIRQAWPSISREEECGRLCPPGTGKSQGHSDGRLVRNTERALRHAQDQGQEEENRDPVHLLRHPHSERSPPGGASGRAARDQGGIRDSETELRWSPPKRTPNLVIGKVSKFTTLECRYTSKRQLKLDAWDIKIPS